MSDRCEPTPDPAPPVPLPEAPEAEPTDDDPEVEPFAAVFPAGSYAARVVADGATAFWRLGEASGTVANDSIGTAHGTISGGVTLGQPSPLRDGNAAMLFNGTTAKVVTPNTVNMLTPCTLEWWMLTTFVGAERGVLSTRSGAGGSNFVVTLTSVGKLYLYSSAGGTGIHPTVVSNGQWHHVALVLTSTNAVNLYIDGVVAPLVFDGGAYGAGSNTRPLEIGADLLGSSYFPGSIDDVALYARALSASEIAAHYALRSWYPPFTPGSYPARVVADGASYFWRLGDGAGTQATEVLAGAHGTISGGVTLAQPGAVLGDGAMRFDGVDDKILTTATVTLPVACTVEAWIQVASGVTGQRPLLSMGVFDTSDDLYAGLLNGRLWVYNIGPVTGVRVVADGAWHHVVYVFTGSVATFFVDGVQDQAGGFSRPLSSGVLGIGHSAALAEFWSGSLDDVAVYPTALSPAQILAHYQARVSPYAPGSYAYQVIQGGASNFWRLSETSGTTAVDIVGGANGVISGGVTLGQPGGVPGDTAMLFNGSTGKVQTAASLTLPLVATVEAWMKTTEGALQRPVLSFRSASASATYAGISGGKLFIFPGGLVGLRSVSDGGWHHVVYVLDGTTAAFYVDGVFDRTVAAARTALAGQAGIGWDLWAGQFWPGSLDEVAIYPRALTAPEVAAHYAAGTTLGPGDKTTQFVLWQRANNAWNNEQVGMALGGLGTVASKYDLTTVVSRFIWGDAVSTQNPDIAHSRYQNMVLADGASHFWRLSDTGTTAVDIAGGVSGTLSGGVTTGAAGAFSGDTAMTFDGVDDKVVTAATVPIPLVCTVEAWVKVAVGGQHVALSTRGMPGSAGDTITFGELNRFLYAYSVGVSSGSRVMDDGQWHHAVWVLTGTTCVIYLDGTLDTTTAQARTTPSSGPAGIAWSQGDPSFWSGSLDNVAIYPRALSAAEVARHYAARG